MTNNFPKLSNHLVTQISSNIDTNAMMKVMWKNQFGDKVLNEVHAHNLSKYEDQKLQEQSLSPFKTAHLSQKVDNLEKEASHLKIKKVELKESLASIDTKMDEQANTIGEVLLVQQ